MKKVFLLSASDKSINLIKELLEKKNFEKIHCEKTVKEAKEILKKEKFDLVIINSPLSDGSGADIALEAMGDGILQVIFASSSEEAKVLEKNGIFVIKKPFGGNIFKITLDMAEVAFNRMKMLINKNNELMQQIEEIKLVNRAKAILIKTFGMNENEAHKYLERQAMDLRKTKVYIAEKILNTYEM